MSRQYFVSYVVEVPGNKDLTFGWTVVSRDKSIESVDDLESVQSSITSDLREKIGYVVNVRLISWRRMEQE